jgi:hypothetical protein
VKFWQCLKIFSIGEAIGNLLELSLISKISQMVVFFVIGGEYKQSAGDALTCSLIASMCLANLLPPFQIIGHLTF